METFGNFSERSNYFKSFFIILVWTNGNEGLTKRQRCASCEESINHHQLLVLLSRDDKSKLLSEHMKTTFSVGMKTNFKKCFKYYF